jgi:guanylate kinase
MIIINADTTRQPRAGESNCKDYHFVTRPQFEADIVAGKFIEHAVFGGNMYGTSIAAVEQVSKGPHPKICILDIDRQGVQSVKRTDMNARYVFIRPPSVEELARRLRERGTETDESFQKRMATVQDDLTFADQPGSYDLIIVNEHLEDAYQKLRKFILDHYDIEETAAVQATA